MLLTHDALEFSRFYNKSNLHYAYKDTLDNLLGGIKL